MSSTENDQLRPLILDIGSDFFRLGFAGEDYPEIIVPSVYVDSTDYLFTSEVIDGLDDIYIQESFERHLFGNEALKYQNILKIHEFKKENNFNILLKYFMYYYQELKIDPENQFKQPLVILAPFFLTDIEKTKLQHIFFNFFKFPSVLFLSETQAILAALQKTTGVVVNMGESNTYISTIFHGFTNIMARDVFPVAGKDLTNYFLNMIISEKKIGLGESVYVDKWLAKEIKNKTSLCILEPKEESKRIRDGLTKYNQPISFPNGTSLIINSERFMVAEPYFTPRLLHVDYIGIDEAIAKIIKTWDRENWEELVPNIILAGGGSLIPGFNDRLKQELLKHFPEKLQNMLTIIAASGRENMAWIGVSILYSKGQLEKGWISNPMYEQTQQEEVVQQSQENSNNQNLE